MFDDINGQKILSRVPGKLKDDSARALWRKIQSELSTGGTGAVETYLNSHFQEVATRLRAQLEIAKSADDNAGSK